ncbi:universal stress protein [Ruegeria arenilitoris]|uniref:universal stress protein n=1 Tax=Ruegeria arenilitoris TaxID=1173585 RepID=UPI00147AE37A|nr:universal stress protein [Ruegeria arenilitoris]
MPLKDILVAYSNGSTSKTVLNFGLSLADQAGAKITAIHVTPPVMEENQILSWMPEQLMKQVQRANEEAPIKAKEALDLQIGTFRTVNWRVESGDISDKLASHSRLHDLLIVGKYSETTEESGTHVRSEHVVTRSGRPLIVVPQTWNSEGPLKKVVVAWDGGLTATRALCDLLHLLPFIEHLDVVSVTQASENASPLKELKEHLSQHCQNFSITALKPQGTTASQILKYCRETQTDILAVGSRGTARLRSGLVHGGTGRTILDRSEIPVLVSH